MQKERSERLAFDSESNLRLAAVEKEMHSRRTQASGSSQTVNARDSLCVVWRVDKQNMPKPKMVELAEQVFSDVDGLQRMCCDRMRNVPTVALV